MSRTFLWKGIETICVFPSGKLAISEEEGVENVIEVRPDFSEPVFFE
jgi:hypothetical protein